MAVSQSRLYNFVNDKNAGTPITASKVDAELNAQIAALNRKVIAASTAPSSPIDGDSWIDLSQDPPVMKIYDQTNTGWTDAGIWSDFGSYDAKTALADADSVVINDSAESDELKEVTIANLRKLANNSYLKGLNAAGDGTVDLIKANASDVPVLPDGTQMASNAAPDDDVDIANKKYVDDIVSDMPTGLLRAATALSGNGAYTSTDGQYSYLSIGKNSVGKTVMASGVEDTGVAIPLPTDCAAADCHWIVSVVCVSGISFAMAGWECSVAETTRVVTIRARNNNWVS